MRTGGYNGRRKGGCSLENRGTVRSVAKAMELLQLLSERGEPLSLTEIARMQELPKSTAFGLLNTLREYEMVSQGRDGRYSLGIRLFEYGCRVSRAWDVPRLARPYLEQLTAQVNVSAVLSIREGDRVMTLDQVEGHGSLRVVSEVGGRLPLHCTSQGKEMCIRDSLGIQLDLAADTVGVDDPAHGNKFRTHGFRSFWRKFPIYYTGNLPVMQEVITLFSFVSRQ